MNFPYIKRAGWSVKNAVIGKRVKINAELKNVFDQTTIFFDIYQANGKKVDSIQTRAKNGKATASWRVIGLHQSNVNKKLAYTFKAKIRPSQLGITPIKTLQIEQ